MNMILGLVLILFLGSVSSELKVPSCRIVYDKFDRQSLASRHFLSDEKKHWPNDEVPYVISNKYPSKYVTLLKSAMKAIEDVSCVKWVPRKGQRSFVYINSEEEGCFANLGYNSRRGQHNLNLQMPDGRSTCMVKGIAVHEMLHILSSAHEQCRPDRDEFVKVHWNNMDRSTYHNYFKSLPPKSTAKVPMCDPTIVMDFNRCWSGYRANTYGFSYDYGSIMHYGLTDFTITGYPTMTLRKRLRYKIDIGQRKAMTRLDIKKLNAAYKCNEEKTPKPIRTTRGPYTFGPTAPRCFDEYPDWCHEKRGYCLVFWFYMKSNCELTCGVCEA